MVKILEPSVPSGSASRVAKTAARDTAGAAYVGLVALVGFGAAMWIKSKASGFIAAKSASEAPSQVNSLFTMG